MMYSLYVAFRGFSASARRKRLDFVLTLFLNYALARIEDGRLELVPHSARVGDKIALLKGGKCPFVVRPAKIQWVLTHRRLLCVWHDGRGKW